MIYPTEFPEKRTNEFAEKAVYGKLKTIANKNDIYYSTVYSEPRDGEIDFIVAVLTADKVLKSVIVIEVKGGKLDYTYENGWVQNNIKIDSPVVQAKAQMHYIIDRFKEISSHVPIGWMVCFADFHYDQNISLPLELPSSHLIDKGKLELISSVIHDFSSELQKNKPHLKGLGFDYYNRFFRSVLLQDFTTSDNLARRMKYDEEQLIKLTENQAEIVRSALLNKRLIVKGNAGTGKTLIANWIAMDYMNLGKKILYICFNKVLANFINSNTTHLMPGKTLPYGSLISTYHAFSFKVLEKYKPEFWGKNYTNDEFFTLDLPAALQSIHSELEESDLFDLIIIDEGQDFSEFWYDSLFPFLKSTSSLFIFMDDYQNIHDNCTYFEGIENFPVVMLNLNCRNTTKISEYISNEIKENIICRQGMPEGSVHLIYFKNSVDQAQKIVDEIEKLLADNIRPADITILLNTPSLETSCLSKINKIKKNSFNEVKEGIQFSTIGFTVANISRFKGLESDIVFIIDTDKAIYDPFTRYTQASRAKHMLYVFLKEE